jgi:hypothetical protein
LAPSRDGGPFAARGEEDCGFARTSGSWATGNLAWDEVLPGEGIRRMVAMHFRDARGIGDHGRGALKIPSQWVFPKPLLYAVVYGT